MPAGRPGMPEEVKTKILTLHAQGLSDNQIGAEVGCSRQNIYLFRHAHGLEANHNYERTAPSPKTKESGGVHWSSALTPDQWEVVRQFFRSAIDRKVYGRLKTG
jgi:hypothetical protein